MKTFTRHIMLLLSAYFLLFSVLPQDYGFLGKVVSSIEKMTADASDIGDCAPAEEEEENSPPTLVEEEDHYITEHLSHTFILSEIPEQYYLSNENCKGIRPSIPLPPPDRFTA